MQYFRNTNQIQTIDNRVVRGNKGIEAEINWIFTETGADGTLYIDNNGVPSYPPVVVSNTSSGSLPVFPNSTVTARLTGSGWPVDGPTISTLIVTGSGLFFSASSYISSSVLTTNFIASESLSYGVTGSIYYETASYNPGPCMETFYYFSGPGVWNYTLTTCAGIPQASVSGSGLLSGSFGPVDWNSVNVGGDATNRPRVFVAPYSSSFKSAAIGNGTSVTFTNPLTASEDTRAILLASWIPLNSSEYEYQFIHPVEPGNPPNTLTVCTRFPEQTFLTPGAGDGGTALGSEAYLTRLNRLYITSGSSCTI